MIKSKLPNNVLGKIWKLADVDKDGMLDSDEFALAMHLINVKLDGKCQRCNEDLFDAFQTAPLSLNWPSLFIMGSLISPSEKSSFFGLR